MRMGSVGWIAALVAVTAGCGLTGSVPSEPAKQSGSITVGDNSRQTTSVTCSQTEWTLSITANAEPGSARAMLQLGGERPDVRSVSFENIDGLSGVSGGTVGKAEAGLKGNSIYTVSGTAHVTDPAHPAQTTDMPFSIEAPC